MNQEEPPLYESQELTNLVKKWVNLNRIKSKDYLNLTDSFNTKLKAFTNTLQTKELKFNKRSIFHVLDGLFN